MKPGIFGSDPYQAYQQMVALVQQQRWAEALTAGRTFVNAPLFVSARDRAQGYYLMGICYNELAQYADAEKMYEEAARNDADNPEISLALWYNRARNQYRWGISLYNSGKQSESQPHFHQAMNCALKARTIDPDDSDTQHLIALIQHAH